MQSDSARPSSRVAASPRIFNSPATRRACEAVVGPLVESLERRALLSVAQPVAFNIASIMPAETATHHTTAAHSRTATVVTDKLDYQPGQQAIITGKGFRSRERVRLQVLHIDGTPNTAPEHQPWTVRADKNGRVRTKYLVGEDDLQTTLQVTATGLGSHRTAQEIFTDALTATTTTLASNFTPAVYGEATTFTATVTGGVTPTGSVNFYDNGTLMGTIPVAANGRAQITAGALTPGVHPITAKYSGDTKHATSTSTVLSQTVNRASTTTVVTSSAAGGGGAVVRPDHIVIVMEEDRASAAVGSSEMPYFNQLAQTGLDYTNSHGVAHPSLPNSLALFSGSTQGITDNYGGYSFDGNNLAQELNAAGLSFTGFSESMPADGSQVQEAPDPTVDPDNHPDMYVRRYNPMAQFNNAGPGKTNADINKTFASFPSDYSTLPTVSMIIPDEFHNTHGSNEEPYTDQSSDKDRLRVEADQWLQQNLDGYVQWAKTHNSLLILTQTEEEYTGGSSPTITTIFNGAASLVAPGTNDNPVNHYNVLRTIEDMYGLPAMGNSAIVPGLHTNTQGQLAPPDGPGTIAVGQPVTFTATVAAGAPGAGTPTGTVQFKIDGANFGSPVSLTGASAASPAISSLTSGDHSVTAVYSSDTNFAASTAPNITQPVAQGTTATSTALSSSNPTTVFGQSVTISASVTASGPGTPTGSVTFTDGTTTLGTGTLDGTGVATLTSSTLATGSHSINASYGGDANYQSSTAPTFTQAVGQSSTSTSLASNFPTSVFGQTVTLTATVAATAPGLGTPSGSIQFVIDGANFASPMALSGGSATSALISSLTVASHTVSAIFSGSTNFATSNSADVAQVVGQASTQTTVSGPGTAAIGQSVSFGAIIAPIAPGAGTPTGTVQFQVDGVNLGSPVALSGGWATSPSTSSLGSGPHNITATYSGDLSFTTSNGGTTIQITSLPTTSTSLGSSAAPSVFGQSVTLTATISETASGTPTGTVTFFDGATQIGTGSVDGTGKATLATSALAVASHSITASYGGDSSFSGSTSGAFTQVVGQAATTTAVVSNLNPATAGQSVSFTATVAAVTPGAGIPAGTVQFQIDGVNFGSPVTLVSGSATSAVTTTLTAGTHVVTAVYAGNTNFKTSTATTLTETIRPANDAFANRITLTGSTITTTGTNLLATKETSEPNHAGNAGGKSVWWSWKATTTGTVQIDTSGSNFDTLLAVYTGTSVSALTAVTNGSNDNDPAGGTTSKATFNVTAGTTYQIAVDGNAGASGNVSVHLNFSSAVPAAPTNVAATDGTLSDRVRVTWTASIGALGYDVYRSTTNTSSTAAVVGSNVTAATFDDLTAVAGTTYFYWVKAKNPSGASAFSTSNSGFRSSAAPANDNFANRITITGKTATVTGSNVGATKEAAEPNHAGWPSGGKSVWWTWTASSSGTLKLDTNGTAFDTLLAVYTGTSVSALTAVTNGSDRGGTGFAAVQITVTAGKTYQIAVDGFNAASGAITMHLSLT